MDAPANSLDKIVDYLGKEIDSLLQHQSKTIPKEQLHQTSREHVDRIFGLSNRSPQVLRNLATLYNTGGLAHTGYVSILPVDQGIEHSAGSAFAPNPIYLNPENIIKLAIEAGCNAVATTFGGLSLFSRKYAHKIPFLVKINHNELLSYPNNVGPQENYLETEEHTH